MKRRIGTIHTRGDDDTDHGIIKMRPVLSRRPQGCLSRMRYTHVCGVCVRVCVDVQACCPYTWLLINHSGACNMPRTRTKAGSAWLAAVQLRSADSRHLPSKPLGRSLGSVPKIALVHLSLDCPKPGG